MMTAAEVIADLDRALQARGELVTLRRYTAPNGSPRPKVDLADVWAFVRPLEAEDLVGNIDSTFSKVIVSPTGKSSLLPFLKNDKVLIDGRERNVELPKSIRYQNVLVRIVLMVGG